MELSPLIIYESFVLAIGIAAVIAFAIFYFRLLRGYTSLRVDHEKLKKELDEYGNIIHATSKQHIEKLVAHSNDLSDELKNTVTELLRSQAKKESGAYESVVKNVGLELEKESKAQVQEFAASLSKEVSESETEIRGQISKLYEDARVEIDKMRADAHQELDAMKVEAKKELRSRIYSIVESVVREATGKLLSKQDHEGIVLDDLESSMRSQGMEEQ